MSKFKKISASNFETNRFYQLPKFLFEDSYFSKMSTDAKVMYSILKDRFELSKKNNWIDNDGNIYLLYTNKQLCKILDYSEPKIIKLKKELETYNLISNERQGLNKPNKIYLLEPNYDKELKNFKFQNKKTLSSGTKKNLVPELKEFKPSDINNSDTNNNDTNNNDMNDMNDKKINKFEQETIKFYLLETFPNNLQRYLYNFDINEIEILKSVILKAKKSFNNNHNTIYRFEDIEDELLNVIKRFKNILITKNESVKNMQSYLMKSIKSELEEKYSLDNRRKNLQSFYENTYNS
ncbi:replication initiator protein A [Staphylococcus hominis]|uniref:replication initiator protein A n=1 Tax=Staphylococcus hominis TaxID=1290 RepID=UPI0021A4F32B|nr:replication initiator protein A [Staphylococcus hominis]MCT1509003.1 replication initiator protein A [Staphylococcus hominis]